MPKKSGMCFGKKDYKEDIRMWFLLKEKKFCLEVFKGCFELKA